MTSELTLPPSGEKSINKKREKQKITRSFICYILGIFFYWSAYFAIINLQSSINVEDGLGTSTLGASYLMSVLCGILLTPVAIRKFGAKVCMIVGDLSLLPYILANLYPTYYTLLPAGIVMASLQSLVWPSMTMINVLFASQFSGVSKRSKDLHVIIFSGRFFTGFQASQVFGSLVSYIILYGIDRIPLPDTVPSINCTIAANISCEKTTVDYSHCGAYDCQNATIVAGAIEQYKPVNSFSLYVLIGITIFFEVLALLVHSIFLPSDVKFENKMKEYHAAKIAEQSNDCSEPMIELMELHDDGDTATEEAPVSKEGCPLALETAKAVFKHATNVKFLLLVPITIYNGLAMSFVTGELTRAFASCSMGVQWVGICMAVYGLSDALLSWVVGKFGRRVGRIPMFLISLVLECGNYIYCLFWSTGPNVLLSVLALFFLFGVTDGILQTIINVTHIDFFSNNQVVAIAIWNVAVESGLGLGFLLSTAFCVSTRIYFNIGFLTVGCVGVVIAEFYHRKVASKPISENRGLGGSKVTETQQEEENCENMPTTSFVQSHNFSS